MATHWAGIFPAVWTPTQADGTLMAAELRANLAFLKRRQVHGFMALGSTGEFPLLEPATRKRVLEEIIGAADSQPVVANISDVRPAVVAELGRFAKRAGAAAVAVLPPSFFHVAQCDLAEFFVRAAEAAQLPLVLYNFPERTGIRVELETIARVAERCPVVAVKHSGSDFGYHQPLVQLGRDKNFVVFTGADTQLPEALQAGVCGSISGMANAVPELLVEIFSACSVGTGEQAPVAAERMRTLGARLNRLWFPLNISALMAARGLTVGKPKEIVSAATWQLYDPLVEEFRRCFQEWNLDVGPAR